MAWAIVFFATFFVLFRGVYWVIGRFEPSLFTAKAMLLLVSLVTFAWALCTIVR